MGILPILSIASLAVGIVSSAWGLNVAYRSSVRKGYAAERDFAELRTSYGKIASELKAIAAEHDRRFDSLDRELVELKALTQFTAFGSKIENLK